MMVHGNKNAGLQIFILITRISLLVCILGFFKSLAAGDVNDATISGFVLDETNGEALIGVNIFLEETLIGGSTNLSGYYVVPEIPAGTYTIVFSHVGYKPVRKTVSLVPRQRTHRSSSVAFL